MTTWMPFGVHALMSARTHTDRVAVAQRLVAGLGGKGDVYTREDFAWSDCEQTQGTYTWTAFDAIYTDCASNGLRIYPILDKPPVWAVGGTATSDPSWANGNATTTASWRRAPISGTPLTQFAAWCAAFAARYGPSGTFWAANPGITYLPSLYFEVWNEPYMAGYWYTTGTGTLMTNTGTDYAAMYAACADAIHAANPNAKVHAAVDSGTSYLGSGVAPYGDWMVPFLSTTGIPAKIDGISVHVYPSFWRPATYHTTNTPRGPYGQEWKKSFTQTHRLFDYRAILAQYSLASLPIWITEIGYPTQPGGTTPGLTEALQAARVNDLYGLLRGNHNSAAGAIWYTLQSPAALSDQASQAGYDNTDRYRFYGLWHNDDPAGYGYGGAATVKPAWTALCTEAALGVRTDLV